MDNLPNISFVGRSISRREDQRLLTGRGQFIADLQLPQMLHAAFVRSPLAHARIKAIDLSRAAASPGIIYALSGPELTQQLPPVPDTQLALPSKWTTLVQHVNPQQPLLAYDKVRHVGEAVAVILAESQIALLGHLSVNRWSGDVSARLSEYGSTLRAVMASTKRLKLKQQSRRRYAANGFAFVPIRAVFLDGIRWVVGPMVNSAAVFTFSPTGRA